MARNADLMAKANHPERVRLLWDVCQIPDFRKVMAEAHTRLLESIFTHLTGPGRRLPPDWLAAQVKRQDRTDGDIETLMGRIAATRTWTYISNRADWVKDAPHWQGVTRAIEDRLSDALHERLTQRFVDRRTAVLVKRMRESSELFSHVDKGGRVQVEGQAVGQLAGFRFQSDQSTGAHAARAVLSAAGRALRPEIAQRVQTLCDAADDAFALTMDGEILWREDPIARLLPGPAPLSPQMEASASDLLESAQRERIRKRAQSWIKAFIAQHFGPLVDPETALPPGAMRGLLHSLGLGLGTVPRQAVAQQIAALTDKERARLTQWGIRLGSRDVFVAWLLKPPPLALRALLLAVHQHSAPLLLDAAPCCPAAAAMDPAPLGYAALAGLWLRVDALDKFCGKVAAAAKASPQGLVPAPAWAQSLHLSAAQMENLLIALGYGKSPSGFVIKGRRRQTPPKPAIDPDNPFAVLKRR